MSVPSYPLFCLAIFYVLILQTSSIFLLFMSFRVRRSRVEKSTKFCRGRSLKILERIFRVNPQLVYTKKSRRIFLVVGMTNNAKLLLIIFLALVIRLIPTIFFPFGSGYDLNSFRWAGEQILSGKDIYWGLGVRHHYAFLPAYGILTAIISNISNMTSVPFLILTKIPIIISDSLIAVLIYLIGKNFRFSLLYALSPIPIILCSYFGQFDAIPLFFSLLSLYLIVQKKPLTGGLALGMGAIFKPWTLLFAPLIFFRQKNNIGRLKISIGLIGPIILITGLYKYLIPQANLKIMFGAIAAYESVTGWWGPSVILPLLSKWLTFPKFALYATEISKVITVMLIFLISNNRKNNIYNTAKLIVLTIYIFSLGFAIQYLLWILPFILITKDKNLKHYLLFTGSYYILFGALRLLDYNFQPLILPNIVYLPASFLLWCFFARWGWKIFKKSYKLFY